jgi:hypothetical protein
MNPIFTTTRTLLEPDTYIYIGWAFFIVLTILVGLLWWKGKRRWVKYAVSAPLLFLWLVFLYGSYIGVNELRVRHIELTFDDLPEAFDGYKIVQFSDAHVGTLTGSRRALLEEAVDSINAQKADLVAFTGDLQNKIPSEILPVQELLKSIQAKDGIYSVIGNHDYPIYFKGDEYEKYDSMNVRVAVDRKLGWNLLVNERLTIRRGNDRILIAGMDNDGDGERFPQNGDIQETLFGVSRQDFVVMLEHDPSSWRRTILPHSHTQLTLSGHTHGGQLSLLGLSPAKLKYHESYGLYKINGRYLYVTSGISGVVPFRFGVPAEIAVITLRKSKN